jgi:hypothetical protein
MVDSKLFNYWVLTGQENKGTRVYTPKKAALGNTQQTEKEGFEIKENKILQESQDKKASSDNAPIDLPYIQGISDQKN